nr:immunoglobulin light chain junction region [Macaca mulatta]
CTQGIQFPFTF